MTATELIPKHWYWIRRADGSLAPYVFHKLGEDRGGRVVGEFFVGSFLVPFKLSQVVAEASDVAQSEPACPLTE